MKTNYKQITSTIATTDMENVNGLDITKRYSCINQDDNSNSDKVSKHSLIISKTEKTSLKLIITKIR